MMPPLALAGASTDVGWRLLEICTLFAQAGIAVDNARLYREARPGSDYQFSLNLLKKFKALHPGVPTKSGLMVGLGETDDEIVARIHKVLEHIEPERVYLTTDCGLKALPRFCAIEKLKALSRAAARVRNEIGARSAA